MGIGDEGRMNREGLGSKCDGIYDAESPKN